jgi:uncharacterized protein with HEPN domain
MEMSNEKNRTAMRNILTHKYFGVNTQIVRDVVRNKRVLFLKDSKTMDMDGFQIQG